MKRILVISDRYPPMTEGGAEVSLSMVLSRAQGVEAKISVLVLDHTSRKIVRTTHQGIDVHSIPFLYAWPHNVWFRHRWADRWPFSRWPLAWKLPLALLYLLSKSSISRRNRWRAIRLKRQLDAWRLSGFFPTFDEEIQFSALTRRAFQQCFDEVQPDLLHADNCWSILVAASFAPPDIPIVAMVRDNRFLCSARGQPTHINGKACTACKFECTVGLPIEVGDTVRRFMSRDIGFRHRSLQRADSVIVTSQYLRRQIELVIPPERIHVVANPADDVGYVGSFQRNVTQANPPQVLIVGGIGYNKGQFQVLRWMKLFSRQLPDFRIVLAGRGNSMIAQLADEAKRMGMEDRLVFAGYLGREELYKAYAQATVVACPNQWPEPFGRVPLEAGLSRRPIVAYASGGIVENVIHDVTGLLVEPGENEAFAVALLRVIKDPALASRLGNGGYDHVVAKFGIDQAVTNTANVWKIALANGNASRPHPVP